VSLSKTVHSSLDHVLSALHDPILLIDLGPLVVGHTVDPSDPDLYHITDKLTVLGYFHTETKFTSRFTRMEDGVSSSVKAGLGTVITTHWTARSTSEGTEILEECSVEVTLTTLPGIINLADFST
jgi:hypothetical protein